MKLAAIDVGTNSTRLLVAGVDTPSDAGTFVTLDRRMRITRLGEGVDASRRLKPEAIERTIEVLREYGRVLDEHGVDRFRVVATSATRDAVNREEFVGAATDVLGASPAVLSGEEEARLSFHGATTGLDEPAPFLVVDIGGGSTEVVVGESEPTGLVSLDMGCVRTTEQFLVSDPPSPEELSEAVQVVRMHLADVDRELPVAAEAKTLVGLAGTVSTVAAVEMGLSEYDAERIHHFRLTREAAEDVFRTLATESAAQRRHNPGLDPGRVDTIVGGAIVLVSIMRHWEFEEMLVSEADILDGIIRTLL